MVKEVSSGVRYLEQNHSELQQLLKVLSDNGILLGVFRNVFCKTTRVKANMSRKNWKNFSFYIDVKCSRSQDTYLP